MTTGLTAVLDTLEGLNIGDLAGTLTNTRVPDAVVDLERLRGLVKAEGLNDALVPAKRPDVFDFQTACRSVETRRGKGTRKGERVSVAEVVTNDAESVYQVTRELLDESNRVIDHEKGMRVVFDKHRPPADPIRVEPFEFAHYEALKHLEDEIKLRFHALRGTVPGAKVRAILRELFRQMNATRWSSTNSVWFVPIEYAEQLARIERVLRGAYGDGAEFDTIPLPNTTGVRRIVEGKIGQHAHADAAKLMTEIAEKLGGGGDITQVTFERQRDKARELHTYAKRMEDMLGGEIATAREALRLVDEQLMEMWGRVK